MKKMICLFLVFCFVVIFGNYSVYAEYDKEILFRNIPWGSTYGEVKEALADLDAEWETPYNYAHNSIRGIIDERLPERKNAYTICYVTLKNIKDKVAGYPLKSITLYFAFNDIENPYLEDTSLFLAVYTFEYGSMTETEKDDLLNTLEQVYGPYDTMEDYHSPGLGYWDYGIIGKDNSEVHFYRSGLIKVYYLGGNGASTAQQNYEELMKSSISNTDGL